MKRPCRKYDDYKEMLDREKPDIVSIDGPFERHAEMCIEALKRNCHILCEKPIALTLSELAKIKATYSNYTHLNLCSMVALRYENAFLAAKKSIDNNDIGEIKLINTQKSYKLGIRPDYFKKKESYGGTIPWVGSHAIDWILWFSNSKLKSVYSTHQTFDQRISGEMEMIAQCQMVLENDVLANITIDYLRPEKAPSWGDDRMRIVGTKGIIEIVDGSCKLTNNRGVQTLTCKKQKTLFSDFVNDLTGKVECLNNTEQTFDLTEACLLARESAETKQIIYRENKARV